MDDKTKNALDILIAMGIMANEYCERIEEEIKENQKYLKMIDERKNELSVSGASRLTIAMLKYERACKKICEQEGWLKEEPANG